MITEDKKMFTLKELGILLFKAGTLIFSLMVLYFSLKEDLRSFMADQRAENKITQSGIEALRVEAVRTDNRLNEFERWKFQVDASLKEK